MGGYRQRMINESEGDKQSAINKAQGEAESIRLRAEAQAATIRMIAEAEAERTRMASHATADGLRAVAEATEAPGGRDAVVQRLAEKYVEELAEMAKNSKMLIVPDRPNDLAGVLTTALGVMDTVKGMENKIN